MEARWYQTEAVDVTMKFIEGLRDKTKEHPLIVCPTGAGKSFILSQITKLLVEKSDRVLIVSHVEDIITQDEEAILELLPQEIVGVYSAGVGRKERKLVTVASIQSIYRKAELFTGYKYIIIDEAHTMPKTGTGMYRTLVNTIPNAIVIGLTATPFRLGSGYLVDGDTALFTKVIYDVPVERLIKEGYLSPLLTNATKNELDTEDVRTVAGDFSSKDMLDKFDKNSVTGKVVQELVTYKEKYKSWLLFAIDIQHAKHICELLCQSGVNTGVVHSRQPRKVRRDSINMLKSGAYQALVSVATLTTGFNHPRIDLIGLIRPTKSPVLHIQMIGRGLRIHPKKEHCLVLDFAGNIMRLGPINDVHLAVKGKKKGDKGAPIKVCPACLCHIPAGSGACYFCGHIFPPKTGTELSHVASSLAVVVDKKDKAKLNGWHPVSTVVYSDYISIKNKNSMRVTYTLANKRIVHEYINPFNNTKTSYNHIQWWKFRSSEPLPKTIKEMVHLSDGLKKPKMLKMAFDSTYPRILDASF